MEDEATTEQRELLERTIEQLGPLIREATLEDKPRLLEMAGRFVATTHYQGVINLQHDRVSWLIEMLLDNGKILVAEHRGRVVAMLAFAVTPSLYSEDTVLEEIAWWVEPEERTGNIGRRLFTFCEIWARANGVTVIKMVAPVGGRTGTYYNRQGYTAVETSYFKRL